MNKYVLLAVALFISFPVFATSALDEAYKLYSGSENLTFSAERGKEFWYTKHESKDGKQHDCSACHGKDLTKKGKHLRTGKTIDPMAPSVNSERFTKLRKIKKWFKRN
jgi:cytochrome c553